MSSCFLVPIQENPEISAQQSTESAASLQGFSCSTVCCIYILNVHTHTCISIMPYSEFQGNTPKLPQFHANRTHKDLQSTAIVAYSILKRLIQVPKGAKKIALQSEVPLVLQLGRREGGLEWIRSAMFTRTTQKTGDPQQTFFQPTHANSKMSNRPQNKFQQCKTVWLIASLFVLVFFSLRNMFLFEWDR